MTQALVGIPPEITIQIAESLDIVQHDGGAFSKWVINAEQRQLFHDLWLYKQLFVLKVRQIGASTAVCLDDALWVSANDAAGQRVRCGIVVDTEVKADERVRVCSDFLVQLGLPHIYKKGLNKIEFPNGSEIIGITAGGKRAGASMTFHRLHLTEVPFWRDAVASFTSLMQALIIGGRVIIETTMGLDTTLAKDLWTDDSNDYFKRFFDFEMHEEYRMGYDPKILDQDLEERLLEEGFTNREAMTYWAWLLKNRCGGDIVRCFREYPQKEEHSWMYAEGRWIKKSPVVIDPVERYQVPGVGDHGIIKVFRNPSEGSGYYIMGLDPAGGVGKDNTAIVVVDMISRQIMASLVSPTILIDDAITAAHHLQARYSESYTRPDGKIENRLPLCIVERNGLGMGAVQLAAATGLKFYELQTKEATKYSGLQLVRRYVESGSVFGPEELKDECEELVVDEGKFVGRKDLCMALGFCYNYLATADDPRDEGPPPEGWVDMISALKKAQRGK